MNAKSTCHRLAFEGATPKNIKVAIERLTKVEF